MRNDLPSIAIVDDDPAVPRSVVRLAEQIEIIRKPN